MPEVITAENDVELLLLKQRKAKLLQRKIEAIKADGLPFYKPHFKQDLFHRATQKRRGLFTGNRFGKSTCGCAEDCAWLRGERPWLSENDVARKSGIPERAVKGLVITTNWEKVDQVFTSQRGEEGKLWKFLAAGSYRIRRNHEGVINVIELIGNRKSVLRFATVKSWLNDPNSIESTDNDFIHVDEPCPESMFKGAARGLVDRDGYAWFTLTALSEAWITDAFLPGGVFEQSMFKVEGTIYDNPYLTKDAIAMFEATLTDDEKECRLYGKPLHLAGLVYKEFKYDEHVLQSLPRGWRSFSEPPKDWSYYYYIDPHPRVPNMVLYLAVDPKGDWFFFHDSFVPGKRRDMCDEMHSVLDGRNIVRGRCDPIAFIEDKETGRTWADDFSDLGFPVTKAVKDPLHGISRTQEVLKQRPVRIHFTPSCRRTLWEIQRWNWDQETNKPVDRDDHAMECLYRAVLDEPCWVDPQAYSRSIGDEAFASPRFDLDRDWLKPTRASLHTI